MKSPVVSVVMSVYNGMPYLPLAVESILSQSFADFEFIIIDDGSIDDSTAYLGRIVDSRLRLIRNDKNIGMAASLNKGIELASGKYIARIDADDIAVRERLEWQVRSLESDPLTVLCGGAAAVIDEHGNPLYVWKPTVSALRIKWKLLFKNPFVHSSVMFRTETARTHGIYYQNLYGTEDYKFWSELCCYGKPINLSETLCFYRSHPGSMTHYNNVPMWETRIQIASINQSRLLNDSSVGTLAAEELIRFDGDGKGATYNTINQYFRLIWRFCKDYRHDLEINSFMDWIQRRFMSRLSNDALKALYLLRINCGRLLLRIV